MLLKTDTISVNIQRMTKSGMQQKSILMKLVYIFLVSIANSFQLLDWLSRKAHTWTGGTLQKVESNDGRSKIKTAGGARAAVKKNFQKVLIQRQNIKSSLLINSRLFLFFI